MDSNVVLTKILVFKYVFLIIRNLNITENCTLSSLMKITIGTIPQNS